MSPHRGLLLHIDTGRMAPLGIGDLVRACLKPVIISTFMSAPLNVLPEDRTQRAAVMNCSWLNTIIKRSRLDKSWFTTHWARPKNSTNDSEPSPSTYSGFGSFQ